ncbi:hypothetical protein K6119_08020 [Paracrocinitomix mangrovi]|uniref:hypothetical protein n=1 Tax=Paracrocinitomix mangrovi TaxID=2862509 RepID=UPI001C8E4FFA|nr:hypothetical protein [Paracrocinitomix mangrovi]UKN03458.1 hypothetical protein K6119_08020 [Paracrocinitomix mangrovi]
MTSEEFVKGFKDLKDDLIKEYLNSQQTEVGKKIAELHLEDKSQIKSILDGALTDCMYSILLGLDGCASIGNNMQQPFQIKDENGQAVSEGDGTLEALAYDFFHGERS